MTGDAVPVVDGVDRAVAHAHVLDPPVAVRDHDVVPDAPLRAATVRRHRARRSTRRRLAVAAKSNRSEWGAGYTRRRGDGHRVVECTQRSRCGRGHRDEPRQPDGQRPHHARRSADRRARPWPELLGGEVAGAAAASGRRAARGAGIVRRRRGRCGARSTARRYADVDAGAVALHHDGAAVGELDAVDAAARRVEEPVAVDAGAEVLAAPARRPRRRCRRDPSVPNSARSSGRSTPPQAATCAAITSPSPFTRVDHGEPTRGTHPLAVRYERWFGTRSGGQRWRPHSVLSRPAQRPARASSPSPTGRVHGQQPIES